jgi:hypothetical protein
MAIPDKRGNYIHSLFIVENNKNIEQAVITTIIAFPPVASVKKPN